MSGRLITYLRLFLVTCKFIYKRYSCPAFDLFNVLCFDLRIIECSLDGSQDLFRCSGEQLPYPGKDLPGDVLYLRCGIKKLRRVEITYEKVFGEKKRQKYIVEPVGLLFSEYYFYLNAYIDEADENGVLVHKYQYPALFRLDRIVARKDSGERFKVIYSNRFEEGEFRKRTQFMFPGKLQKLQFKYYGPNVDAVLDRLPTAKVVQEKSKYQLIEAEVSGTGIVMWLLSQGKNVEVIRPESLREEMKAVLTEMLGYY